jgi:hypothetical protein
MKLTRTLSVITLFILVGSSQMVFAQMSEQRIKALFVVNICKESKLPTSGDDHFVIAFFGKDEDLQNELAGMVANKKMQEKPIKLIHASSLTDLKADVVIVSLSKSKEFADYAKSNKVNFYTFSQKNGLCEAGSMVNFVKIDDKIKFEICEPAMKHAGIIMASNLRSMAVKNYTSEFVSSL